MTDREQYVRYGNDVKVLAAIGEQVAAQAGPVTVRLPKALAESAMAAWEREELSGRDPETHEEYTRRAGAAELAFIGLEISNHGRWEGEEVVVDLDLDVASAGAALRASQ
ncbi:hypothetical protein BCL76_104434 [Streptomyces sp. CG 926]|uniref:hypothetical protein n=1 Tax=Streptomyces sp. CG 926 TaxID=1882405 RepID=UPI000D6D3B0F|nr:hypothetical protein [Streptomyces sp. CG 926]PWK71328.1 hypothetical protein BCL76_104434 [Streptomyces sp. CG 926]